MSNMGSLNHQQHIIPGFVSWFSSPLVEIKFQHQKCLKIHRDILFRIPMLKEELQAVKQWDHKIDLPSTSYQAGHALVNYLYCGSLDCHGHGSNNGPPPQQKLALLLEIYALARTYVLPGLEVLAREELESLAAKFSPFELFDAAKISYPTSVGDDVWFPGFVKVCIKAALQNPSSLQVERNLTDYTNGGSLVKLFLSCVWEVHIEELLKAKFPCTSFANDEAASEASDDAMMQPTPSEVTSTTERSPTSTSQLMVTQQHEAKDDSSPTPVYRDLVNLLERLKKCSTETDPYDKDYLKGNWRWG